MAEERRYFVYILASQMHGTLYIGITNDLARRAYEHREHLVPGFTKQYGVDRLVYYEIFDDPASAIAREKRLKKYKREWKINLIEQMNPGWFELYPTLQL